MKIKTLTAAAFAVSMSSFAAYAGDAGFSGNTIHSESPGFGVLSFAMAKDGTFGRSDGITGTWKFENGTLCYFADGQDDLCGVFDGSKQVGDKWQEAAWDGNGDAQLWITAGLDHPTK